MQTNIAIEEEEEEDNNNVKNARYCFAFRYALTLVHKITELSKEEEEEKEEKKEKKKKKKNNNDNNNNNASFCFLPSDTPWPWYTRLKNCPKRRRRQTPCFTRWYLIRWPRR